MDHEIITFVLYIKCISNLVFLNSLEKQILKATQKSKTHVQKKYIEVCQAGGSMLTIARSNKKETLSEYCRKE